jgi:integrase/recombinase XerD
MSNIKNKKLLELKKLVKSQKEKYGITENFSYRFDYRTKRLILSYYVPLVVKQNGRIKNKMMKKERYYRDINESNYKRYFKGDRTIVKDDAQFVKQQIKEFDTNYGLGDEYDFKWWVENYLSRVVGKTKGMKLLSPSTLKSNRFHINEYYLWCIEHHKESLDIFNHIDNGMDWFEIYYGERLNSKRWAPATIGISYRSVRGFYNYVAEKSKTKFPYDLLKRLQLKTDDKRHNRDSINRFEFELIKDFILKNQNDSYWGKFILMLRLQLKTGMRCGEIVSIRNRNIDITTKQITIVGKGDRTRRLNFSHTTDALIWESILSKMSNGIFLFYRTRVQHFPVEDKMIEVEIDKDQHTTTSYYSQRFRKMRDTLGLRGKGVITSHSIRRYWITRFVGEGNTRDLASRLAGHTTTRMIDYYMGELIEPETITTIDIGV